MTKIKLTRETKSPTYRIKQKAQTKYFHKICGSGNHEDKREGLAQSRNWEYLSDTYNKKRQQFQEAGV